jgi:hypothetical protein
MDMEPAVIGVAKRERIDVKRALKDAQSITNDETLAQELVRIAIDADKTTINDLLQAVERIKDEMWRARTLFSLFRQTNSQLRKDLPKAAQDKVVALVKGIADEAAQATALRNLSSDLPAALQTQLASLGEEITDPLRRLQVALHYETEPTEERRQSFLETAKGLEDQEMRGQALAIVAPLLNTTQLEEAFAAAKAIEDPDVAGPVLVRIAARFPDSDRRQQAQVKILDLASSIADPVRKFDVMAALRDLPVDRQRSTESLLFDLATQFEDPEVRCRAMFLAGGFAQDEVLQQRSFLAGLAAAEVIWDEQRRAELFLLLRPVAPTLAPTVRRELTRAVERLENPEIQRRLYGVLGRFFIYERESQTTGEAAPRREEKWDIFISYSTADIDKARSLASELKSRGMRVFLSADVLDAAVGSASWTAAIDEALVESRALLVLLTADALASKWVTEEWRKYYRLMVERAAGRLLSLRLGGPPISELPLTLQMYQIIDSKTGQIEPSHLTRIMDIVRGS